MRDTSDIRRMVRRTRTTTGTTGSGMWTTGGARSKNQQEMNEINVDL